MREHGNIVCTGNFHAQSQSLILIVSITLPFIPNFVLPLPSLVFTNQNDRGNHINVAGGGVVKYAKNKENAIALLEFLTQPNAQVLYSTMNYEYPVNPLTELSDELKSWGSFKEDQLPVEKLAELAPIAQKIIDRVGW